MLREGGERKRGSTPPEAVVPPAVGYVRRGLDSRLRRTRTAGRLYAAALVCALAAPAVCGGQEGERAPAGDSAPEIGERERLTGDWGGLRGRLEELGIGFEFVYTGEVFGVLSGGRSRGAVYLDNFDLRLRLELERLTGWEGGRLFLYGLGNHGGSPSRKAGDAQAISNIDAPSTWKLFEAWFEQEFHEGRLAVLGGLYAVDSEFDVITSAAFFLHSSHGTGAEFAQSGKNGPSIFPVTSLGARVKARPFEDFYVQAAILDGVPGDPGDPGGTQIILAGEDGVLAVGEAGLLFPSGRAGGGLPGPPERAGRREPALEEVLNGLDAKIAAGAWYYSARFEHLLDRDAAGDPVRRRGNHGAYLLAEAALWREGGAEGQGLTGFVRLGYADPRFNRFEFYTGGGIVYRGLIPGRDEDQIGFAAAAAYNGAEFRRAEARRGVRRSGAELALEWNYRAVLAPWFALHGDVQYVIDPDTDPDLDDALAVGLRAEVSF